MPSPAAGPTPQFAGKYSVASEDPDHPTVYGTPSRVPGSELVFPAMAASQVTDAETWIAYGTGDGTILQMGDLKYLARQDDIGTVVATSLRSDAASFQWAAEAPGSVVTTLSIAVPGQGWQPVRYGFNVFLPSYLVYPVPPDPYPDPGDPSEPDATALSTFVRTLVTPSLATIQETRSAAGLDLRWVDLTGADLEGVDLRGARLDGATLDGASITGGSLEGATLVGASLKGTDVTGTTLDSAIFDGTDIGSVVWGPGSHAAGASFRGCVGVGATIGSSAAETKAVWTKAVLVGADLSYSDLSHVDLSAASLEACVLVGATLQSTNLSRAVLGGVSKSTAANLSYAYLTNVDFDTANCFGVSFAFASVFGGLTNLTETSTLEQADFANAYLEGINFSGATLRGSRFDNACLVGANLTNADLGPTTDGSTETSLAGAVLSGAHFTQATLTSVDLTHATVAFADGTLDVRYCSGGEAFPPPPDFLPMNHAPTTGLDATTLAGDTVCPNGSTYAANLARGLDLRQMLTIANPATRWVPVGCQAP